MSNSDLLAQRRSEHLVQQSFKGTDPITIAVVWPRNLDLFYEGVHLAKEEINARGGIHGRKLEILEYEEPPPDQLYKSHERNYAQRVAHRIANKVSENINTVAVIGHALSNTAIPASIIYDKHGIVYVAPAATNIMLSRHNFKYLFRTIVDNDNLARQMAAYCYYHGFKKIVVISTRGSVYSEELAASFSKYAVRYDLKIIFSGSFNPPPPNEVRPDYRPLIAQFRGRNFDIIFLTTWTDPARFFINQSRQMNITAPFIGGDAIEGEQLLAGHQRPEFLENTTLFSPYSPSSSAAEKFELAFYHRFNKKPDKWAAQGYDAIKLLEYGMAQPPITPLLISNTLRFMKYWLGVTGLHAYDERGELTGKKVFFQQIKKNVLQYLPEAHIPYTIEQICIKRTIQEYERLKNSEPANSTSLFNSKEIDHEKRAEITKNCISRAKEYSTANR